MDFSKLLHGFFKINTYISFPLPNQIKLAKISLKWIVTWFVKVVIQICQNCCRHFSPSAEASRSLVEVSSSTIAVRDVRSVSGMSKRVLRVLKRDCVIFRIVDV